MEEPTRAAEETPYALLGGDTGVRALVDAFYDRMDLDEAYAGIRALHPPSLDGSRDKLYWYLSGWLGGPSLYIERFGHPRLRARHLPYAIGAPSATSGCRAWQAAMADRGCRRRCRGGC